MNTYNHQHQSVLYVLIYSISQSSVISVNLLLYDHFIQQIICNPF